MDTNPSNREVLIVGAGPVGLTLANDLAQRGVPIRIIDALPTANPHAKAHGLQARTLEGLDIIGLGGAMMRAAVTPQPTILNWANGRAVSELPAGGALRLPYPYQLSIWQQAIEKVLADSLAELGHQVHRSSRLVDFEIDEDGVDVEIEQDGGRHRIRVGWIVGCDGGRSAVRNRLGLQMHGDAEPGKWFIGEFDMDWNTSRDVIFFGRHRKGSAIAFFDPHTERWHAWVTLLEDKIPLTLENFNEIWHEYTGLNTNVSNPLWMHELRVNYGTVDRYRDRRVFLAGDAAHVHSSAGGQGLNTGVQDALNLGWKLALTIDDRAASSLLDTYTEERLAEARNVLARSKRMHRVMYPRGLGSRVVSSAMAMAVRSPVLAERLAARRMSMVHINYLDSTLSWNNSRQEPADARAGSFVPDVSCRRAGRGTSLFSVLRGPTAELLLYAGETPSFDVVSRLAQIAKQLSALQDLLRVHFVFQTEVDARKLGREVDAADVIIDGGRKMRGSLGLSKPEIIYVRPDGYIGYRSTALDGPQLAEYLRRVYASRMLEELNDGNR
ncbi:FAD-dependent monooxygenase [Nocardia sp. NPDC001965]